MATRTARRSPPLHDFHQPPRCGHAAAECAASACVLCVCCPLTLLWCCVMLPCRLACRAARRAADCARPAQHRGIPSASPSSYDSDFDPDPRARVARHLGRRGGQDSSGVSLRLGMYRSSASISSPSSASLL